VDAGIAGSCPEPPEPREPSGEQVAAILGPVAAGSFEATIEAQEVLLGQLLPALAAREELLGRASAGVLLVWVPPKVLPAEVAPHRPAGPT
jgi:hypothetical protein